MNTKNQTGDVFPYLKPSDFDGHTEFSRMTSEQRMEALASTALFVAENRGRASSCPRADPAGGIDRARSGLDAEARRKFLSMSLCRARESSGSYQAREPKRTTIQPVPDLRSLLTGVPFAIVGGMATRLYMPERMTLDIDIVVAAADESLLKIRLRAAQAVLKAPLSVGGHTWELKSGQSLDALVLEEAWTREAIENVVPGPDGQPYVDLPYLVLMKLFAGRVQDLADISRMLGGCDASGLERVRAVIQTYAPTDAEDLESLIKLGQLEHPHE